jgi:hypothetical protein
MASYYRPYLPSDSELSDADSDYSLSPPNSPNLRPDNAGPDIEGAEGPDFAALANALSAPANLIEAAGPSLVTDQQQIAYGENLLDSRTSYSAYGMTDLSGQVLKTTGKDIPSVIMLQSRDRDKSVFIQPTNCQLFLPRIYKNIKGFSIIQINFTSAFYYFRANKYNIESEIQEEGRLIYLADSTATPTLTSNPLKLINKIRDGSYDIDKLLDELSTQLNKTPLFYDFINGFSDFLSIFSVNGDYSLNFNEPGDNYFDAVRKVYIKNPTREIITSFYFQARYSLQYTFSIQQVTNAYYYPVIKEVLLDTEEDITKYKLTYPGKTEKDVKKYLIFFFQGLDDPIATEIINKNIDVLDTYRLYHTFRYSLVNKYVCSFNPSNNRVNINTPTLNTSLTNMLIAQYNSYLDQQLNTRGMSRTQYDTLSTDIVTLLSIIQSMYDYMQVNFAKYFAINFGTYSRDYFTNSSNSLILRPGLDAKGISMTYNTSVGLTTYTNDILKQYQISPSNYWPFMKNLGNTIGAQINMGDATQSYPTSSNNPYVVSASNMDVTRDFIDVSGTIYTDYRRKAGDILVNVEAGKYTIFKFRSPMRQSLQIETLPRQTQFRYPAWNKSNPVKYPIDQIFDISYCFVNPPLGSVLQTNIATIKYKPVYGWSTITNDGMDNVWNYSTNFSATYLASLEFWNGASEELNSTQPNGYYYRFIAPYPTDPVSKGSNVYTYEYSVRIDSVGSPFPVDFYGFFYHDVTAFIADMNFNGGRNENKYHYKHKLIIPATTSSGIYTFKAYAGQTYFMIFRSSTTNSQSVRFRVVPFCPDGDVYNTLTYISNFNPLDDPMTNLNNFHIAKNADPAFIRLPVSTIVNGDDPTNININKPLDTYTTVIGYDISGVSNDLTDYIPFRPNDKLSPISPSAIFRIDPFSDHVFKYTSAYDLTKNSYFTSNTSNLLFTKNADIQYTHKEVLTKRQYKIVQYYATNYLKDSGELTYTPTDISPNVKVYDANTTNGHLGGGYTYDSDNALILDGGVTGFTFLPSDGMWCIDRITFKTNFINSSPTNPKITGSSINSKIYCLGIFVTSAIYSIPIASISLSKALAICVRVQDKIYTTVNQNLGCDAGLGTYHTFSNIGTYDSTTKHIIAKDTSKGISGFSQGARQFITDVNTYYSAIAFTFTDITDILPWNPYDTTENIIKAVEDSIEGNTVAVTKIQNMVGTPIPYPFAGTATTSQVFYDGYKTPSGQDLVVSSPISANNPYGPDPNLGIDESVSQYEQSIALVNSHIHYLIPRNIISDEGGFSEWNGIPSAVDYIHTSVIDDNAKHLHSVDNTTDLSKPDKYVYKDGYALIQAAVFTVVKYKIYTNTSRNTIPDRNFVLAGHLTTDQIFPTHENTSLIAVSGTPTHYIFLGASNIPGETYSQLRFKEYEPILGTLTELPIYTGYKFQNSYNLQHFVFNSSNAWFYTASIANANTDTIVLNGTTQYGSSISNISYEYPSFTQSELQMDPIGLNLYISVYNKPGFSKFNIFSLNSLYEDYYIGNIGTYPSGRTINLDTTALSFNYNYYTQFCVSMNNGIEEVLLLNTDYKSHKYFKIRNYQATADLTTSNTNIDFSKQSFKDSSDNFINVKHLISGGNGSKWALSDSPPYLLGNRNDSYDAPTSFTIAWQIFFPTLKIEMQKLNSGVSPIIDLTSLNSGLTTSSKSDYPEWPHTVMFAYSNYTSLYNDIVKGDGKWGLESNYLVSDVGFSGYDFNSYLVNVPLQSNYGITDTDSNLYYYIAVRGYLPTESFQTMMRFYLPNRYDFGFVRLIDISGEIPMAIASSSNFNPLYRNTLLQFNSNFILKSRNFGSNASQGIAGSNITSSDFGDFLSQYHTFYDSFSQKSKDLININSNVKESINAFIARNLQYILPDGALTRQRFTDPIISRLLWNDNLDNNHIEMDDEWGLGWNLGYSKKDTEPSTSHTGDTFFKIQQDYIYLRLNPEFNINGMDAGGKENYKVSREPSGTTNQYYCKLLLPSFGGNATTFIHNTIIFTPPINRITKLHFQWIDANGFQIDNADCEWDMTVNIIEYSDIANIPSKMDFLVADPKTGLPAPLPANFQAPKLQAQGDFAAQKEKEELEGEKRALHDKAVKAASAESIRTKSNR